MIISSDYEKKRSGIDEALNYNSGLLYYGIDASVAGVDLPGLESTGHLDFDPILNHIR